MTLTVLLTITIFLEIITYIVFFDVILSWLTLFGIKFRPKLLSDIIDPLYKGIKKIIPTSIGPIEFTPIIVILGVYVIKGFIAVTFPEVQTDIINLSR